MNKFSFFTWAPAIMLAMVETMRHMRRNMLGAGLRLAGAQDSAFYLDTPDRLILENVIFPFYQLSPEHQKILFIGCDWYTAGYARCFRLKRYMTMDPDPARATYGAALHQTAPMARLANAHADGSLDLIVCNGIIGWGLNDLGEANTSFDAAYAALRPGGHLIIGWNDLDAHRPFALADVAALGRFERLTFPPLSSAQHRVEHKMRHVFDFYVKP